MNKQVGLSGVQPWSVGAVFPYVVFKREHYSSSEYMAPEVRYLGFEWVVTFAGVELATCETHNEAEDLAALFKHDGVRTVLDVQWKEMEDHMYNLTAGFDAEDLEPSIERMQWRDEHGDRDKVRPLRQY